MQVRGGNGVKTTRRVRLRLAIDAATISVQEVRLEDLAEVLRSVMGGSRNAIGLRSRALQRLSQWRQMSSRPSPSSSARSVHTRPCRHGGQCAVSLAGSSSRFSSGWCTDSSARIQLLSRARSFSLTAGWRHLMTCSPPSASPASDGPFPPSPPALAQPRPPSSPRLQRIEEPSMNAVATLPRMALGRRIIFALFSRLQTTGDALVRVNSDS